MSEKRQDERAMFSDKMLSDQCDSSRIIPAPSQEPDGMPGVEAIDFILMTHTGLQFADDADAQRLRARLFKALSAAVAAERERCASLELPVDAEVHAMAQSDAAFDKRDWLGMPRSERERYLERSKKALYARAHLYAARFAGL